VSKTRKAEREDSGDEVMSEYMNVMEETDCDFCGEKCMVVRLYVEAMGFEDDMAICICLSCLLKAVGLLETELDSGMNEYELEEETRMLEADKLCAGSLF